MACNSCAQALERAAGTVSELARSCPEILPPIPQNLTWELLSELLIRAGGAVRRANSRQDKGLRKPLGPADILGGIVTKGSYERLGAGGFMDRKECRAQLTEKQFNALVEAGQKVAKTQEQLTERQEYAKTVFTLIADTLKVPENAKVGLDEKARELVWEEELKDAPPVPAGA